MFIHECYGFENACFSCYPRRDYLMCIIAFMRHCIYITNNSDLFPFTLPKRNKSYLVRSSKHSSIILHSSPKDMIRANHLWAYMLMIEHQSAQTRSRSNRLLHMFALFAMQNPNECGNWHIKHVRTRQKHYNLVNCAQRCLLFCA